MDELQGYFKEIECCVTLIIRIEGKQVGSPNPGSKCI